MLKIYHIHIRKTAGTVLYKLLLKQFKKNKICPIRSEIALNNKFPRNQRLATIRQYNLVSGHFYTLGKHLIPEYTAFTFLREPIARTLSTFNHIQNDRTDPYHKALKGLSLSEALQSNLAELELNNGQTRFLLGNAGYDHNQLTNNNNIIFIAKSFIDQLFFVGIQELIKPSIEQLALLLHIKPPRRIPQVNTKITQAGLKVSDLSQYDLDLLHAHNTYDFQIYQYALKKFQQELMRPVTTSTLSIG